MAGTIVASVINNDTGLFSTQNAYKGVAKAWVQFSGASPTINGSFNVGSITKIAAGEFTVNFTTAMVDANYAYSVTSSPSAGYGANPGPIAANAINSTGVLVAPTTSSFTFTVFNAGTTGYVDPAQCNVIVCGN